jgi:lipoprotein-anchoring transpeptidase ErfK/SrfK
MRGVAVAVVLVAFVVATRGSDDDFQPNWVATADSGDVPVYPLPDTAEPSLRLGNPRDNGEPLMFLVDDVATDVDVESDKWLPVLLPIRPNGSRGWIRAKDVRLARNDYRITVDIEDKTLTLHHRDEVELRTDIGVGTDNTPTPGGTYFVNELIEPPDPDGLYGAYAFGMSGYSDAPGARDFNGGNGALGIHGTNNPASIGEEVSHGCIRVPNDVITHMATVVPMGTPVEISS